MLDGVHEGVPEHARQKMQEKIPTKIAGFHCNAYKKGRGPNRGITAQPMGLTLAMTAAKKHHQAFAKKGREVDQHRGMKFALFSAQTTS